MKNFCSLKNIGKKLKRHAAEWEEKHPEQGSDAGPGPDCVRVAGIDHKETETQLKTGERVEQTLPRRRYTDGR